MKKVDKTELEQKAFDFCLQEYNKYNGSETKPNKSDKQISDWLNELCPTVTSELAKEIIFDRNLEEYLYNTEEGFAFMFNLQCKLKDSGLFSKISIASMSLQAKLTDSIKSGEMRVVPYWVADIYMSVIDYILRDSVTEQEMNYIKFLSWYITTSTICNAKPLFDKKTTKLVIEYLSGTVTNADKWMAAALWYKSANTSNNTTMSSVIAAMLGKR